MNKRNQKYKSPYLKTYCNFHNKNILLLTLFTMLVSCSQVARSTEVNDYEAYPKASEDATQIYQFSSNMERTHFLVDGKDLGIGRHLIVRLNNQGHTIVAQPEKCSIPKEEYIQPPYSAEAPLSFTFLTGDCEPKNESIAEAMPPIDNRGGNMFIFTGNNQGTISPHDISTNTIPSDKTKTSTQIKPQEKLKPKTSNKNALNEIVMAVEKICYSTQERGRSENWELTGAAKAELNGLIKNLFNLGFEGAAKYQNSNYEGVLQNDLSGLLSQGLDCKREMASLLINRLIK